MACIALLLISWSVTGHPVDSIPGDYTLIAHRGGITGSQFEEYDPAGVEEAIRRGYRMLEVDVNRSKDGVLVLNHDPHFTRFFNNPGRVNEMTWADIQQLRSAKGQFHPPCFDALARACAGRIDLMIDVKLKQPDQVFYDSLLAIMERYDLLKGAYFINNVSANFVKGKGKQHFRVADVPAIKERLLKGENIRDHYFLFDNGIRLTKEAVQWAQANGIAVVPSINKEHYLLQDHWTEARRHITQLQQMGVREFQIDSDYEPWFPAIHEKQRPPAQPAALRFRADHTFRIAQFTDIHYQYRSPRSDSALMQILTVIKQEKPDLAVLTGDIVCSQHTLMAWRALAAAFASAGVPWAVTLGNHDVEYELTGKEIMDCIGGLPYNCTSNGPDSLSGNGNYCLPLLSSGSDKTAAVLYLLDSHTSFRADKSLGEYDWIRLDQINWYKNRSKQFRNANDNEPLPSLAFMHIPLPEYNDLLYKPTTKGIQEELICSPEMNSGFFTAMAEAKDVMGMFCGHDHNNNFIGINRNICLAYGAVSGFECYGKIGRGARIIVLEEGARKFTTWITNSQQQVKYKVVYPGSFIQK